MTSLSSWIENKLLQLNVTETMDKQNGFSRLSFTKEEKAAHVQFEKIASELGLNVHQDAAGNTWAVWEVDHSAPTIALGSHLDTVDSGGGYDGTAGVLTALAAIRELKRSKFIPKKNIAVICFISEESARFGISTIGSKAITGKLNKQELSTMKDRDGVSVQQAITAYGIDFHSIDQAVIPIESLECFIELHIEQGTTLENAGASIGIVKGIACPVRLKVTAEGMANHTGTTPMNRRKDAFVAIAPLVTFVQAEALKVNETSEQPLVATVSTISLKPNAMNVIPGRVELGIDIRSVDDELKRNFAEKIKSYCSEINNKDGVTIEFTTLVDNDSVLLEDTMHDKLLQASESLGYQTISMNSGAGHDVMNMAANWPSGLIFIPCKDGISHHPAEYAAINDLEKGTRVIANFLQVEAGN
ncbi:M20 family metallo-hydrolase [Oceanobacillus saliphilus]|uniref:M20 family metallo-hydrolase n=1 Tax=Oceanobacillus saliphilus TaxID=2925834 RepID=UPI00201DC78E|nr:M20 family metallo-hydrolase [Oceanobacillus saliphilus]